MAKLAENRQQIPAADRPAFLDRLATVEIRLGEPALAREHLRELAGLRPADVPVLMGLFDLAMQAADHADARDLVAKIRSIEGERGTLWRFAKPPSFSTRPVAATNDLEAARVGRRNRRPAPGLVGQLGPACRDRRARWPDRRSDQHYTQAVERGNTQATLARRLVGLLNQRMISTGSIGWSRCSPTGAWPPET